MARSFPIGVLVLLAWGLVGHAAEAGKTPLTGGGFFTEVKGQLGQIFAFTFDGPKLKIDSKSWGAAKPANGANPAAGAIWIGRGRMLNGHPVEPLFQQIQNASGAGGSSMSISNDERRLSYGGGKCSGRICVRGSALRELAFEESGDSGRTIEYSEDGKGGFRLQLAHTDGDLILLMQTPKGAFRAVALVRGETFAGQGESFAAFYKQNRRVMETQILPVFAHLGIQLVLSAQEPKVRKAVTALLQRSPASIEEARKLIGELDSEQFNVREQASKALADRFQIYQDLIRAKQKDTTASLEVKTRIEKIISANADADRVNQTVDLLDLTKDPAYVVTLLDGANGAEAGHLVTHLEKLTGQKLGSDPKAWKEWVEKNAKK